VSSHLQPGVKATFSYARVLSTEGFNHVVLWEKLPRVRLAVPDLIRGNLMLTNSNGKSRLGMAWSLLALLSSIVPASRAQDQPPNAIQYNDMQNNDGADPPSRVARISFLDGSVSMQPGGTVTGVRFDQSARHR
jgi:hypothetical protein